MSDLTPPSPLSILAVDDEPLMRKMLANLLKGMGHSVILANDGVEALQLFQEEKCQLVITDYAMPHMGGDALATAVKKLSPRTPVILITGFQTRVACPAVDCRLQKPFSPGELVKAIADTLAARPAAGGNA